jgi:hypothetical protein
MPEDESRYQCQHCGNPAEVGHNCNGVPFVSVAPQNSIAVTGPQRELLAEKGFCETSNQNGIFYYHPDYGVVSIYAGGTFRTGYRRTPLPLNAYLESLNDSSFTEVDSFDGLPYQTRCDACKEIGPLFPSTGPFPHKQYCPQSKT